MSDFKDLESEILYACDPLLKRRLVNTVIKEAESARRLHIKMGGFILAAEKLANDEKFLCFQRQDVTDEKKNAITFDDDDMKEAFRGFPYFKTSDLDLPNEHKSLPVYLIREAHRLLSNFVRASGNLTLDNYTMYLSFLREDSVVLMSRILNFNNEIVDYLCQESEKLIQIVQEAADYCKERELDIDNGRIAFAKVRDFIRESQLGALFIVVGKLISVMELIALVRSHDTSEEVVSQAIALGKKINSDQVFRGLMY